MIWDGYLMNYVIWKMSCNCFDKHPLSQTLPFGEKYKLSKCSCAARYVVSENRSRFCIEPSDCLNDIDKIKVDGYLVSSTTTKKCDYLFVYKQKGIIKTVIFVELKGVDLNTAVKQIENSVDLFYKESCLVDSDVRGGIVFTNFPKDNGTYRKLKRQIEQKYHSKLKSFRIEQYSKNMIYNCNQDSFRQY